MDEVVRNAFPPETLVLADGVVGPAFLTEHQFGCSTGNQILRFDPEQWGSPLDPIPLNGLSPGRLAQCGDRLLLLDTEGCLFLWTPGTQEGKWHQLPLSFPLLDMTVHRNQVYLLRKGTLLAAGIDGDRLVLKGSEAVPVSAFRVICSGSFLAVMGPGVCRISSIGENGFRPAQEFQCQFPVAFAASDRIALVADHIDGVHRFIFSGDGLKPDGILPDVRHPHAICMTSNGEGWLVAGENGIKGSINCPSPKLMDGPVLGMLQAGPLVAVLEKTHVTVADNTCVRFERTFAGYCYHAALNGACVACASDAGVLYTSNILRQVPMLSNSELSGPPRVVAFSKRHLLVGTSNGMDVFQLDGFDQGRPNQHLVGRGETTALVVDPGRNIGLWSCGRDLRILDLSGPVQVVRCIRLGVYPRALALSQDRILVAAGPGGLLSVRLADTSNPVALPNYSSYVADVAGWNGRTAVSAVKDVFLEGEGEEPGKRGFQGLKDVACCAVTDSGWLFSSGRQLFRLTTLIPHEVPAVLQLSFGPRRLCMVGNDILVAGAGGLLRITWTRQGG